MPTGIAGLPVLLVRNDTGTIGAFHNICRHRCLQLVDAPGNVGRLIRCPYHAWAYDLNGTLCAHPAFGGSGTRRPDGFDPADHSLVPMRIHVWHDWIFINPGGSAPAFETYAEALFRHLADINTERLLPLAVLDFGAVEANWKFIMENFIEPYHVQFVHRTTTDQPLEKHSTFVDGNCVGSAVDLSEQAGEENNEEAGGRARLAVSSRYLTLFPNFILGCYAPDQIGVYLNTPTGPGVTLQKRAIYTTRDDHPGEDRVAALCKLWRQVHGEDHAICERMQRGRASPIAVDGGILSPHWENGVRAFQETVAQAVDGAAR